MKRRLKTATAAFGYTIGFIYTVLFVLTLVFAGKANAADVVGNLSWNPPTEYVDGTPLPASDILQYEVTYSIDSTAIDVATLVTVPPGTGAQVNVVLQPGSHTVNFWVRARLAPTAAICPNCASGWSNMAGKSFEITVDPNAPTNLQFLTVNLSCGTGCTIREIPQPGG